MSFRSDHIYQSDYQVPSGEVLAIQPTGRCAVILGAGPGGLMAALTLKREGIDEVIVFEKRRSFTRRNVVNLHPESLHVLKRLDLLERFLARASRIVEHQGFVFSGGTKVYDFRDVGYEVPIDPEQSFDIQDVMKGFRNETLYSITLADLQALLADVACERGVRIVGDADVTLVPGEGGVYSVRARAGTHRSTIAIDAPTLVVLTEGTKAEIFETIGGEYVEQEGLWPDEAWVFGNYLCAPSHGYSHLLFEFSESCDALTISNCIFLPHTGEVNVSVTVNDPTLTPPRIGEIISRQAATILRVSGIPAPKGRLAWCSERPVHIFPKSAIRFHFGKNIILAGDVAGANSPVAALGATLCTSAYSYAIRELVKDLATEDAQAALARYGERARTYVKLWHDKVSEIRRAVNLDIRDKTLRRTATSYTTAKPKTGMHP